MELIPDFREFIQLLNDNEIEYLVVGGIAVVLYGYPRYTIDIDFWVNPTKQNAKKLLSVLNKFGFQFDNLNEDDLSNDDQIIQLGFPPNRLDIITSVDGLTFEDCYKRKVLFEFKEYHLTVNLLSKDDLIKNKLTTGRSQDLADVDNLPDE
ncbi:MAG: hypothetical protein K1X86_09720 [Ignavibacteria bacterium]|nr:hypothetical protein [Ignavibacteria bacterium]